MHEVLRGKLIEFYFKTYKSSGQEFDEKLQQMTTRLHEIVGETNWNDITDYVNHFYDNPAKKDERNFASKPRAKKNETDSDKTSSDTRKQEAKLPAKKENHHSPKGKVTSHDTALHEEKLALQPQD